MSAPKGTVPWNKGKGQGWIDSRGYRWRYVRENGRSRARREHRLVMEAHLGRRLEPWELVHHRNGNTADNRLENLEIQNWAQHTADHSKGRRKSADARRAMEAFALLREELRHQRRITADLLAALRDLFSADMAHVLMGDGKPDQIRALEAARAAIRKAEGES